MRTLLKLFIVVLILAGGIYFYRHTTSTEDKNSAKTNAPVPVLAAQAVTRDMPIVVDMVGRGEAYESVSLKSRVDGQVQSVQYQEGQRVHTGDLLLRLDPADFNARLQQAAATLAKDRALLRQAQADAARYQKLQQQGFVSEEKLTDLHAAAAAAEATVKADQASLELARLQLSYATIRAPIDGIVGARLVFPGTAIKTNDTVLAVINRVQPLLVDFSLPENYLADLRKELLQGPPKVLVGVPGDKRADEEATVSFVDNAVDPSTGTLLMKARLDNKDGRLSAGQYLRVSLILKTLKDAVVVPSEAVQQGPNGTVVYVVNPDSSITIRQAAVAASRGGLAAIASGLKAGETVVTDGHMRLTPKSKVKFKLAAGPSAAR
ncbi:MAG TPA: efflux RND transporter periplasmic adaptor subunit [Parasulfuritortus sp.]